MPGSTCTETHLHRQDGKAMWHRPRFAIMQQHLILKPWFWMLWGNTRNNQYKNTVVLLIVQQMLSVDMNKTPNGTCSVETLILRRLETEVILFMTVQLKFKLLYFRYGLEKSAVSCGKSKFSFHANSVMAFLRVESYILFFRWVYSIKLDASLL